MSNDSDVEQLKKDMKEVKVELDIIYETLIGIMKLHKATQQEIKCLIHNEVVH